MSPPAKLPMRPNIPVRMPPPQVATYLAALTFKSMGDVFGPAVAVRSWLTNCAKVRA